MQRSSDKGIVISNDTPLSLKMGLLQDPPRCYQWHLYSLLLADKSFVQFISTKITAFLEINSTPGMSSSQSMGNT